MCISACSKKNHEVVIELKNGAPYYFIGHTAVEKNKFNEKLLELTENEYRSSKIDIYFDVRLPLKELDRVRDILVKSGKSNIGIFQYNPITKEIIELKYVGSKKQYKPKM